MPAKRSVPRHVAAPTAPSRGLVSSTYQAFKNPDNAPIVRSVAMFGIAVAFLHSSWSEALVPQF